MKRLDYCKTQLEKTFKETENEQRRILSYQELINHLNTYSEQKQFADHYEKLSEELVLS